MQVTVTLAAGATLPASFDVAVTARSGDRVEGYVGIDRLSALAAHENVTRVAAPERPQLQESGVEATDRGQVAAQSRCSNA